ncbi:MAG: helix-hairpin-helix domain-containing protein, partial [Parachlamydiaceae bacterium]|nr:helix-hairpin-helix domain-containing protein [Parachlamydiaceae bacterium]
MTAQKFDPIPFITNELNLPAKSVASVVALLEEGNTIPFIARYRKEVTDNLDEVEIRNIQEKLAYITELEDRKKTVISSIVSQGKMIPDLQSKISNCLSKTILEDLYLPYKPKRRTRAMIAREKGLEPLALLIMEQSKQKNPQEDAKAFIDPAKGVSDVDEALAGARDIVAEMLSENAEIRAIVRDVFKSEGIVVSKVIDGKDAVPTKFEQYYNYREKTASIPSHRYLAIRRGEREEVLQFHIEIEPEMVLGEIRNKSGVNKASLYAEQLEKSIVDACKRLIFPSVETDLRVELKMQSDRAAVDIFASNLKNLLLSPPLGTYVVIGIDPGLRTGCKCAVVDNTGKFLHTVTIFPGQGERGFDRAEQDLLQLIAKFHPHAIAVGNGTGGRETEQFVRKVLTSANLANITVISVNESGASVYSASDVAREEFPDLDLTIRGAISIARRLQDPLAELVKIDPKSIGVGQYQHDVYQPLLQDKLSEVIESCVNHVGVELNTASASLLAYVAGIGPSMAVKIVKHREINGSFKGRQQLLKVAGLG